jgi:hypothetical protein
MKRVNGGRGVAGSSFGYPLRAVSTAKPARRSFPTGGLRAWEWSGNYRVRDYGGTERRISCGNTAYDADNIVRRDFDHGGGKRG